jgi:RNA-directed DNA polymerase
MADLRPIKISSQSIATIPNLSIALSMSELELDRIRKIPPDLRYKKFTIPKGSGGQRDVYDPIPLLRKVQHRINKRIFQKTIQWPPYLYGSIPNEKVEKDGLSKTKIHRDYIACAQNHCEAKSILKLDISNFFENIHRETVKHIFDEFFHYPDEVAEYLTDICCYGERLIQGALTSSYLASLCLFDQEYKVVQKLNRRNLVYTRLVDDITVSSKFKGYDFSNAESHISNMMLEMDFPLNHSKTKIMRVGSAPLIVHGLIVDFSTLSPYPKLNRSLLEISGLKCRSLN